mmetsp:Transcript_48419/g.96274  ORF Transcript_48419/g.96274 Transcript_48419/m.96274 type:complete len:425 (-) Transcript_48419:101-1375(-)
MEAPSLSTLLGHVDASIEQRSALVTALRAKLGVNESGSGEARTPCSGAMVPGQAIPTDDSFADAMAQLDRGLDARQKLIGALRSQLSRHAAYPKAHAEQTNVAEPATDVGPLLLDEPPSVSAIGGFEPVDSPHQQDILPEIVEVDSDEPPAKRIRPDGELTSMASCPPTDASGTNAATASCGDSVDDAEKAALETRRAAMLKSLQVAEANREPPASPSPPPERPPGAVQQAPIPGQPMSSTAPSPPSAPSMPPCPAGATPEQYEAWRKQCWTVYYEWCSVWQKYYTQNQKGESNGKAGAQSKARMAPGPGGGCIAPAGRGCPPMPASAAQPPPQPPPQQQQQQQQEQQSVLLSQAAAAARGRGAAMATWPPGASGPPAGPSRPVVMPPMPRPDAMVAGRPKVPFPVPGVRSLIEDDIHGKLLGL